MALTSPTKKQDLEMLADYAEFAEITYSIYKKNPTPEVKQYLDTFVENYQELKHQIDTKDYTQDDARYWKIEELFKGISCPQVPSD